MVHGAASEVVLVSLGDHVSKVLGASVFLYPKPIKIKYEYTEEQVSTKMSHLQLKLLQNVYLQLIVT